MACTHSQTFYRRLTFFLAIFVFFENVGTASMLWRLPDDPLDMSYHLSIYSWFASILGILGVVGARKENATLVAIFANYLLIDVILCATPRLLTIGFFPEIRGSICSPDSINARLQALQSSGLLAGPESQGLAEHELTEQCMTVMLVLQMLAGLVAVGFTLLQVVMAIKVRKYSRFLQERQEMIEAEAAPSQEQYKDSPISVQGSFTDEKHAVEV